MSTVPETLVEPVAEHRGTRITPSHLLPSATPARSNDPPLRLRVDGIAGDERNTLTAILSVLEERTQRRWRLDDGPQPDLYLHTRDAEARAHDAQLRGLILRDGEPVPAADTLSIATPLRVMGVLDLLNAAHDRLTQHRLDHQVQANAQQDIAHVQDDSKALASVLARMFEQRLDHSLRVRIVGYGALYLCPSRRSFAIDFPRERLDAALEQHRFVMTTLPSESPALRASLASAQSLDELLWSVGLVTVWEHTGISTARFKLRRWPDLARLPHRPEHIQACAVLAAQAMDLAQLANRCGLSRDDAGHLLHACHLGGLLEFVEAAPQAVAPVMTAEAPRSGLGGLFGRLRKRFGL